MMTEGYFGGGNTAKGFVNYLGAISKDTERLYILKGSSGCGKNSLMKKVAEEAERRGEAVERIYCASDPKSLDGVILWDRKTGVLDGTAPHETTPRLVGAMDNLVDLGEYLNVPMLRERKKEIKELTEKKAECYGRAYGLLAACGRIRNERRRITDGALLSSKLSAAAGRYAEGLCKKEKFEIKLRPMYALCSEGTVRAEGCAGKELWQIKDCADIKGRFFAALVFAAAERGAGLTLSPDPTEPSRLAAVRHEGSGVLFAEDAFGEPARFVNMERFIDRKALVPFKRRLKLLSKTENALKETAVEALCEARKHHLNLEALYIPAMNFDRVNERTERLIKEIFA